MQFGRPKPTLGIVYNTTMNRPDAVLALAMIYGFETLKEAHIASVAINGASLGAAAFCDAVGRFYAGPGPAKNSNSVLPVGLAADKPLPPDIPMVKAVLDRKNEKGEPQYVSGVHKVTDTAEVSALMRNSLTGQSDGFAAVVLAAPATYLARDLDYLGTKGLITTKVRALVISEGPQDPVAMRKVLAEWPTPIFFCPREVGDALPFPASAIDKNFSWAPAHPVVDAYKAFKPMPYDAPSWDMAAMLFAARPEAGLFKLSELGTIQVQDDGRMKFEAGGNGKHRSLSVDPAQKEKILQAYIEIASQKPAPPPPRFRPPQKKEADTTKKDPEVKTPDGKTPEVKQDPPEIKQQ